MIENYVKSQVFKEKKQKNSNLVLHLLMELLLLQELKQ